MTSKLGLIDLLVAIPELFLLIMVVAILLYEVFRKGTEHKKLYVLSLVALIGTAFLIAIQMNSGLSGIESELKNIVTHKPILNFWVGEIRYDQTASFVKIMILAIVAAGLVLSFPRLEDYKLAVPEFYLLMLLSTLGMLTMVSAATMLMLYLSLELMSLPLYALAALNRDHSKGIEAGMKYFIMGATASGIFIFGIALLYGATGSFSFNEIAAFIADSGLREGDFNYKLLLFALIFIIVGVVFKLGGAPFHAWVPDIYEGAPTPSALFISAAPKIAAFIMLESILWVAASHNFIDSWQSVLSVVAIISFILGNFVALRQENFLRMLGYSAVSHAGFMLLGLFIDDSVNYSSGIFYAVTYIITTVAAFGFILIVKNNGRVVENISELKGFGKSHSWMALMLACTMFSMAGFPFFVGFQGKLLVLKSAFNAGFYATVIIALITSVVGSFYYLRVVKVMFFDEATTEDNVTVISSMPSYVLLSFTVIMLAVLGIMPSLILMYV